MATSRGLTAVRTRKEDHPDRLKGPETVLSTWQQDGPMDLASDTVWCCPLLVAS